MSKYFVNTINILTVALTVPVLHPVRSAHGSSFFIGLAVSLNASNTNCRG